MRPVSYLVTNFIEKTMNSKGLSIFITTDGKYLAMDKSYDTIFKFDLAFSDNDFTCKILIKGDGGLVLKDTVNIPWTNGNALREFMEYLRQL